MIADDDHEDQEEVSDISWRSLILAADREGIADRLDCNIFHVVVVALIGFLRLVAIQDVKDTVDDEIT